MGKRDLLKDSMKGGLNSLLSSTTPSYTEDKPAKVATEKETAVHCNFLINKSIHTRYCKRGYEGVFRQIRKEVTYGENNHSDRWS